MYNEKELGILRQCADDPHWDKVNCEYRCALSKRCPLQDRGAMLLDTLNAAVERSNTLEKMVNFLLEDADSHYSPCELMDFDDKLMKGFCDQNCDPPNGVFPRISDCWRAYAMLKVMEDETTRSV